MDDPSFDQAERHLMQLVMAGDAEGWRQLVSRYQTRLLAFAIRRVDQSATAQDIVQETFVNFLESMQGFRGEGGLESFLFRILRRRIADHYRSRGQSKNLPVCEIISGNSNNSVTDQLPSNDLSASQYVRQSEQRDLDQQRLCSAIALVTGELRASKKFRDLKIAEGLFYAGMANRDLAERLSCTANEIAVVKHRLIKRLGDVVNTDAAPQSESYADIVEADLHAAWEWHRPSCPKRSTLGKYTLSILPTDWNDLVHFHVEVLGCTFCLANLEELISNSDANQSRDSSQHLFQSTIGFLPNSNELR